MGVGVGEKWEREAPAHPARCCRGVRSLMCMPRHPRVGVGVTTKVLCKGSPSTWHLYWPPPFMTSSPTLPPHLIPPPLSVLVYSVVTCRPPTGGLFPNLLNDVVSHPPMFLPLSVSFIWCHHQKSRASLHSFSLV